MMDVAVTVRVHSKNNISERQPVRRTTLVFVGRSTHHQPVIVVVDVALAPPRSPTVIMTMNHQQPATLTHIGVQPYDQRGARSASDKTARSTFQHVPPTVTTVLAMPNATYPPEKSPGWLMAE